VADLAAVYARISSKYNFLTPHHREDFGERFIQQQDCLSNMTLNNADHVK